MIKRISTVALSIVGAVISVRERTCRARVPVERDFAAVVFHISGIHIIVFRAVSAALIDDPVYDIIHISGSAGFHGLAKRIRGVFGYVF